MLRRYRGLRGGYDVRSQQVCYEPFRLSLSFRECESFREENRVDFCNGIPAGLNSSILLVILAIPVKSVYKGEEFTQSFFYEKPNLK